jgi:hypothetical protein
MDMSSSGFVVGDCRPRPALEPGARAIARDRRCRLIHSRFTSAKTV